MTLKQNCLGELLSKILYGWEVKSGAVLCWAFILICVSAKAFSQEVERAFAIPAEVIESWNEQQEKMRSWGLQFTERPAGSLSNWNYGVATSFSAYLGGNRLYRKEELTGVEGYDNEFAFDGQTIWMRDGYEVTKRSLENAPGPSPGSLIRWPYLEAAGIWVPQFLSELKNFSTARPLALQYLEVSRLVMVERVGENLSLTLVVADELATAQAALLAKDRTNSQVVGINEGRKVVMLLSPSVAYGIIQREEWNVDGHRISKIHSEDWRFYEAGGIWLPTRSVATYYARPRLYISEYSEQPVHFVINELKQVDFGKTDIQFSFGSEAPQPASIFEEATTSPKAAQASNPFHDEVDTATLERIKAEVVNHSQVMEIASWLTDVFGARLTGSPETKAAADWAVQKIESWGITNTHLEPWGPFPRGWRTERFSFQAIGPRPFVVHAEPLVWSCSTPGRITGPAVRFDVSSFSDMQRFTGKLKGAFLLLDPEQPTPAHFEPLARRLTEERLVQMSGEPEPFIREKDVREIRFTDNLMEDRHVRHWLIQEEVAAVLFTAPGDGGTIFLAGNGGKAARNKENDQQLPMVKVSAESYGRIARILEKGISVTLELEMENTFYDSPEVFNVIAELPGTDLKLKNEVVLLGAHLDSWSFGTGATDNGAGVAVLMEAMRILKALNVEPRRTIRIALWTGEEQGALGSEAYVAQHYRDQISNLEHASFSAYFNLDGGTGKIRGVIDGGNDAASSIFRAWMEPLQNLGMKTVCGWDIGGGDDLSFVKVGLPSFGFLQDPIEYETRTHHSNADVYERLQEEDLRFNSAVIAFFAWQAAQREEKFPRE